MPVSTRSLDATSIEEFFQSELTHQERAITGHLETLRLLASRVSIVCEFGVKRGASSAALLLGADEVYSYDIKETKEARRLEALACGRWHYMVANSLDVMIPACDLLFIDSLHTFAQCDAELRRHATRVLRFLVFHDSMTFGVIGADGETGHPLWTQAQGQAVPSGAWGIRPAIDNLMIREPWWRIVRHDYHSHGLLVVERT